MSRVAPKRKEEMDSVREQKLCVGERRAFDLLMEAQRHWSNLQQFRQDRERNKKYTYGDQWQDVITVDGQTMTEEEYIKSQGNIPLKNNLIRRLVRTIVGIYRNQSKEPTCIARDRDEQKYGEMMSTVLQCNMQLNRMSEVLARSIEEFLISGFIVHRKWYGWRGDKLDCWTDYVQPNNFFIDTNMRDFRGFDCSCVGEVHDVSFQELCGMFAENAADYKRLKEIYSTSHDRQLLALNAMQFGYSRSNSWDFLLSSDVSRCRVIEMWRKESKPRYRCHDYNSGEVYKVEVSEYSELVEAENARRLNDGLQAGMSEEDIPLIESEWFIDNYWYYYFLTPFGHILKEGETPYAHKSHPYVFKAYPFIDGEIHSFVGDAIDQQRYVNRLITMHDWILRASAKGVLIFPEEALPNDMSLEDIADEWSRFNGMIVVKTKDGAPMPHQISNNATNIGIGDLLGMQLKLFEDITGVQGSLQGKPGFSGMSASLYAQQTANANTSLMDFLESFSSFVIDGAKKDIYNIQQYYDEKRIFNIAGSKNQITYDPEVLSEIEFDLSISESTQTPAYRLLANDFLMQIWQSGQISLEMLLEYGNFPFADELLNALKTQKEQMEQGQQPQALPQELQQQAMQGANSQAMAQLEEMLRQQPQGDETINNVEQ